MNIKNPGDLGSVPNNSKYEPFVRRAELRAAFTIGDTTLDDWMKQGVPHIRVSKRSIRWRISEVAEWRRQLTLEGKS